MMTSIDKVFYKHAEEFFGRTAMQHITDDQVEEARVFTCRLIHDKVEAEGIPINVNQWEIFNNYLFENFF